MRLPRARFGRYVALFGFRKADIAADKGEGTKAPTTTSAPTN
jgi:hypothetical protein